MRVSSGTVRLLSASGDPGGGGGGQMKPSTPGRGRGACVASSLGYRRGRRDQRCGLERFDEDDRWNSGANFDGFSRCVYRVDHIEAYR